MRALSACLTVVLGLGVAAIAACSSTASDDTAGGGSAGATTGGTSAGGTSAGGTGGASAGTSAGGTDVGAGGAPECSFDSPDCGTCLGTMCSDSFMACGNDSTCGLALSNLEPCVCGGMSTTTECETTFIGTGDKAKALADCFDAKCKSACE
jgi:hypothetical protein